MTASTRFFEQKTLAGLYHTLEQWKMLLHCFLKIFLTTALNKLTLSHIQQICSRRLWKHPGKNMENPYKWGYNYWKKLKTSRQKEKLLVLSNFFFCHDVFKRHQKESVCGKGLRDNFNMSKCWHQYAVKYFYWSIIILKHTSDHFVNLCVNKYLRHGICFPLKNVTLILLRDHLLHEGVFLCGF